MNPSFEIRAIDIKHATTEEYRAANVFNNRMQAERLPDDPPISLDEQIREYQNIPSFVDVNAWVVWNTTDSSAVGVGVVVFMLTETNQHIGELDIQVLPDYRRQGIARRLLALTTETAQRANRRLFIANTNERIPAGEAFMRRLGAKRGMETHTNQLAIAELNHELVHEWQARAQERASGFELGFWDGAYPEENIEEIAQLFRVMNTAPHDDLDIEDFNFTVEQMRERVRTTVARGRELWTMYVREKKTGKFVGFTEIFLNPSRPEILNQAGTGVLPEYRNYGLGRWLKAAMLDKILRERPQAKFIRTGNADSNAPMLKINHELGFKPYISQTVWQVEVERAREYVASRQSSVASIQ
ncbi:MAG: GNAT family N-acetyltransferase [Chloroflexi bacterium]|nr:GNAT family N-acetyltransferase [Chloroflexota bacterium]